MNKCVPPTPGHLKPSLMANIGTPHVGNGRESGLPASGVIWTRLIGILHTCQGGVV